MFEKGARDSGRDRVTCAGDSGRDRVTCAGDSGRDRDRVTVAGTG